MSEHSHGNVQIFQDSAAIAEAAAHQFVALAQRSVETTGRFSVALAGGTTPMAMYALLAQPPFRDQVPWSHLHLFWSDERYVPPDDSESNFRMVREALLDHIAIPAANIYLIPTVGSTVEGTAESYEETIKAFFDGAPPRFDLILLGVGPDGHTASLFPGFPEVVRPSGRLVAAVHNSPKPPPDRITFTLPLINAAMNVMVLANGVEKATAVRNALRPHEGEELLPVALVQPTNGTLLWFVDEAAMTY
jgi:6-phosphogluconolactonase